MSEDDGLLGKLVMSVIVLAFSPFIEIVTGAAPIGAATALFSLTAIWGVDTGVEPEDVEAEGENK